MHLARISAARVPCSRPRHLTPLSIRRYKADNSAGKAQPDGFVVGIENGKLSQAGLQIDGRLNGRLGALAREHKLSKLGDSLYFLGLDERHPRIAVVATNSENIKDKREISRRAAAAGVKAMKQLGAEKVAVDPFYDLEEGAYLQQYSFSLFKNQKKDAAEKKAPAALVPLVDGLAAAEWDTGRLLANAQNLARDLENGPSNHITPTQFAKEVRTQFEAVNAKGSVVEIVERDQAWAEQKKMGCFLGVAKGSEEPLRFLELHYRQGGSAPPIVLVGKGITFDSGGISIKPSNDMGLMRGDMSGAATCVSTLLAAASLGLKRNITVLVPLCENMPSGKATKPGDILTASTGLTVEIENTDAEGRLILADALAYADSFQPGVIIDVATLTGAIEVALGKLVMGVYSNSTEEWERLKVASLKSGEHAWRMPIVPDYEDLLKSQIADLANSSKSRSAGSCVAASFLERFVKKGTKWMHIDMAGVMHNIPVPYLREGMTGIPVRTLVEYLRGEDRLQGKILGPFEQQ